MIAATEKAIFVALCALLLPPLGYSFFFILTAGAAGVGLLLGIPTLLGKIYETGVVPTVIAAAVYVLLLPRAPVWLASLVVTVLGTAAAYVWWTAGMGIELKAEYFSLAVLLSGAMAVSLIPAIGRARFQRRQDQPPSVLPR